MVACMNTHGVVDACLPVLIFAVTFSLDEHFSPSSFKDFYFIGSPPGVLTFIVLLFYYLLVERRFSDSPFWLTVLGGVLFFLPTLTVTSAVTEDARRKAWLAFNINELQRQRLAATNAPTAFRGRRGGQRHGPW